MYDLGIWRKRLDPTRYPIIKTHPNANEEITGADGHIGSVGTVHTQHSHPERMGPRKAAKAHKRSCDRRVARLGKLGQFLRCPRKYDATPGKDNRLFGFFNKLNRPLQLSYVWLVFGFVGDNARLWQGFVLGLTLDHILRKIHQHRTRPA